MLELMIDNGKDIISELDGLMYVVLSKAKKKNHVLCGQLVGTA